VAQPAYKDEVLQIEPKGIEHIVEGERHGRSTSVFTLWIGANVEMATLVTGTLGVVVFGLSFWQAALAFIIGTALGAALLGLLSTFGPRLGAPQLVISRRAFGFFGNFAPGILNIVAGIGWYAVNSVLGVFALAYLLGAPYWLGTVIMVVLQGLVAVYGHNLIHSLERYLSIFLVVVFLIVSVYVAGHMNSGLAASATGPGLSGGFIATLGVAFAYMAGWMAFASDYTRYLPTQTPRLRVFGAAFLGNLVGAGWPGLLGVALASMAPKLVGNGTSTLTRRSCRTPSRFSCSSRWRSAPSPRTCSTSTRLRSRRSSSTCP
jgi:NCS1 family nucleobase:cation symporter-1